MRTLLLMIACTLPAQGQIPWLGSFEVKPGAPSGACGAAVAHLDPVGKALYVCNDNNTWNTTPILSASSSSSLPSGSMLMIASGTCPGGFTESTAMNGKMLRGTLAANGDVGTTGGSSTITPAGAVSVNPITDIINHTHAVNITDPGHTHTLQAQGSTTAATTGTHIMTSTATGGSSRAMASPEQANSKVTGITATTSNPVGGVASIIPVANFTGTPFDPSPSYVKVIFCAAN